jgi:hypothetical protein
MARKKKTSISDNLILDDRSVVVVQEGPKWVVLQSQPNIRTLKFTSGQSRIERQCIQLALPYVIFGFFEWTSRNLKDNPYYTLVLGFSNKPLTSKNDLVYYPLFPNIQHDMTVCMHGTEIPKRNRLSWQECCASFWMKSFNMYGSLTGTRWPATTLLCDTFLRSYKRWSEISLEKGSPDFMLDFDKLYKHIRVPPIKLMAFIDKLKLKTRQMGYET